MWLKETYRSKISLCMNLLIVWVLNHLGLNNNNKVQLEVFDIWCTAEETSPPPAQASGRKNALEASFLFLKSLTNYFSAATGEVGVARLRAVVSQHLPNSRELRWTPCCVVLLRPYCPWVFLVHSLAHSSQWFRYSVVSLSLNVARQRGHCRSDSPWLPCQVIFSAAIATEAAGFCWTSAVLLKRGSEESLCRLEVILCPMWTRQTGISSLGSLPAPCWHQSRAVRLGRACQWSPLGSATGGGLTCLCSCRLNWPTCSFRSAISPCARSLSARSDLKSSS